MAIHTYSGTENRLPLCSHVVSSNNDYSLYSILFLGPNQWGLIDLCFMTNIEHHWLFYSDASQILDQTAYLRALWSIFLAGFMESVKRTAVAMHFGKRTFSEFKPRLEQILKDITLLAEVSELAQEAFADNAKLEGNGVKLIGEVDWNVSRNKLVGEQRMVSEDLTDDEESDEETETDEFSSQNCLRANSFVSLRAKEFLESWEEPAKKKVSLYQCSLERH